MVSHIITDPKSGEKRCTCFKRCGGCQLDKSYKEQLEWKQQKAVRMLSRYCKVDPIIGMDNPYYYRNKVQTVFGRDGRGRLLRGVFQSGSGKLVATEDCMLEDKVCNRAAAVFARLMQQLHISYYDNNTGKGIVRHLLARYSRSTDQLMLCICAAIPVIPSKKVLVSELRKALPQLKTIVLNIGTKPMPLMLGDREEILFGDGYIEDIILGKRFRVSAQSFYQVNSVQTERLYAEAVAMADLTQEDTLIDAYCGTGTIGIICSDKAGTVIGAEINSSACRNAAQNISLNGADNVRIVNEDAGRFMHELAQKGEHISAVITDPPRAGCDKRFLDSLCMLAPDRVVYISCKIESLARDLGMLTHNGYKAVKILPVDMFPHTTGIETVVLLKRK